MLYKDTLSGCACCPISPPPLPLSPQWQQSTRRHHSLTVRSKRLSRSPLLVGMVVCRTLISPTTTRRMQEVRTCVHFSHGNVLTALALLRFGCRSPVSCKRFLAVRLSPSEYNFSSIAKQTWAKSSLPLRLRRSNKPKDDYSQKILQPLSKLLL